MHNMVGLDELYGTALFHELEECIKKAAKASGMEYELWHQDEALSYLERWEGNFRRSIQISLYKDVGGLFIAFIPGLEQYEGKKRRMLSSIHQAWIPSLHLSQLNEQCFMKTLQTAIDYSYHITPAMFDREDELDYEFRPAEKGSIKPDTTTCSYGPADKD